MAAAPQLEELVEPPFSPSLFLDLPPTPHADDPNDDDLLLPFISRMLMEDDIDDKFFYQFPDHPTLLNAQQSYAQILDAPSSAPTNNKSNSSDDSGSATDTLAMPDHCGATQSQSALFAGADNMEMLNMAFLKGREEANKFLPTNSTLFAGFHGAARLNKEPLVDEPTFMFGPSRGRGRKNRHGQEDDLEAETSRSNKLMVPEQEDTAAAGKIFDEIILNGYQMIIEGIDELRVAMGSEAEKKARNGNGAGRRASRSRAKKAVVDLHILLIQCAQAVATGEQRSATELLNQIKQHSSPRGDATQRLACFFAEGLEARLAGTGSQVYQSLMAKRTSTVDFLKAYKLFTSACCVKKVNVIFSNKTIYNAVAGRRKLHIVDYGLSYGFQWPALFLLLGAREGGPPEVRMTGIDVPQPGFRPADQIEETGGRLSNCARQFGVPFKFRAIAAKWETVRREDLDVDPEEVLVVNCLHGLNNLQEESLVVDRASPRDVVLTNIRDMRPHVFVQCVVNGAYGAPFFLTRFREVLFFYSAQFDMLDATIPRDNDERLLIERDILGRCALNVIACEGADRVDRPETYKQWQVRNHRAGLTQLPLEPQVVELVRHKVTSLYHKDFVIDVDHQWLLQGWKGRTLYAMSTWVAHPDHKSLF